MKAIPVLQPIHNHVYRASRGKLLKKNHNLYRKSCVQTEKLQLFLDGHWLDGPSSGQGQSYPPVIILCIIEVLYFYTAVGQRSYDNSINSTRPGSSVWFVSGKRMGTRVNLWAMERGNLFSLNKQKIFLMNVCIHIQFSMTASVPSVTPFTTGSHFEATLLFLAAANPCCPRQPCSEGKQTPHGSHLRGTTKQNDSLITLCGGPCNCKRVEHFLIIITHRHKLISCALCILSMPR